MRSPKNNYCIRRARQPGHQTFGKEMFFPWHQHIRFAKVYEPRELAITYPFLAAMTSYHVLALPSFCGLFIGKAVDANIPRFVEEFRRLEEQKGFWFATLVQDDLDRESLLQAIEAAKQDFDPTVTPTVYEVLGAAVAFCSCAATLWRAIIVQCFVENVNAV